MWRQALPVGLLLSFVVGCGSGQTVSGQVTYGGKPLSGATISFTREGSKDVPISAEMVDGAFKVPADSSLKSGKYLVRIEPLPEAPVDDAPSVYVQFKPFEAHVDVRAGDKSLKFDVPE